MPNIKIGLALSGGGAMGAAHIGLIEELNRNNIEISYISGSSAGSIVSYVYSYSGINGLNNFADRINSNYFVKDKKDLIKHGLSIIFVKLAEELKKVSKNKKPKITFSCIATNIHTNQPECFENPSVKMIMASSSYPGIFPKQKIDKQYYIDGALTKNLPGDIVREKTDFVIGSSIYDLNTLDEKEAKRINRIGLAKRAIDIMQMSLANSQEKFCDFVFKPNVNAYRWYDIRKIIEIREVGRKKAKKDIKTILKLIKEKNDV